MRDDAPARPPERARRRAGRRVAGWWSGSRPLIAGAAALALVGLSPGTAMAASGRITQVDADGAKLRLVFAADSLPANASVDPASVTVSVDGTPLADAKAERISGASVERTAVLVIDTSLSMRGERIAGAQTAATAFVDSVPPEVKIGLVTFAQTAGVVRVPPTTDRAAVKNAIDGIRVGGETALYDGVILGLREVGTTGVRSVLVLSDGDDTSSRSDLAAVLNAARAAKDVTIDTVAFQTRVETGRILKQISDTSKGRTVTAARAADVGAAFRESARAISNQVVVTATLPATLKGAVTIAVTATAGTETLTDEVLKEVDATVAASAQARPPFEVEVDALGSKSTLAIALVAVFAALGLLLAMAAGALSGEHRTGRVRRRLSLYTLAGRGAQPERVETTALGESGVARSAVELADRVMRQRGFEQNLARQLERAGSVLKPAEWLLIHAGVTLGASLLCLLLTGGNPVAAALGFVFGFSAPYLYLSFRASRRTNAFLSQMPDTLQLMAGSLSAGYSLPQAVDAVVREGAQPIAGEFSRALVESRLGVPMEDALDGIATRLDSRDFKWVVMAIRIQREVGGNLAEVLGTVANTMRDRERVRRQVKVLSAEGRLSAMILGGLPPLFAVYLALVRPTYIKVLFTDKIGWLMLFVAACLFVGGVFWLRKVVKVEV